MTGVLVEVQAPDSPAPVLRQALLGVGGDWREVFDYCHEDADVFEVRRRVELAGPWI